MALTTIVSALDNTVVVQLDVTNGTVTALSATNGSTRNVTVNLTRPNGSVVSRVLTAGTNASVSIPKGKQFPYADDVLSDWQLSISLG